MDINLMDKLSSLKARIPAEEWKYFHLESMDNFIFHLKNIAGDRTRDMIAGDLFEYLTMVESELAANKTLSDSFKDLYAEKLYPISMFYEDELKFIHKPYYPLRVILFAGYFFLLYKSFTLNIAIPVWFVSVIAYIIYLWSKFKSRKWY